MLLLILCSHPADGLFMWTVPWIEKSANETGLDFHVKSNRKSSGISFAMQALQALPPVNALPAWDNHNRPTQFCNDKFPKSIRFYTSDSHAHYAVIRKITFVHLTINKRTNSKPLCQPSGFTIMVMVQVCHNTKQKIKECQQIFLFYDELQLATFIYSKPLISDGLYLFHV